MFKNHYSSIAIVFFLAPQDAFAYGRGGSCGYSSLCTFTGVLIGSICFGFIALSIYQNIRDKGLIKGVKEHPVIKAIIWYLLGIMGMVLVLAEIAKYHKELAIIICLILMFLLPSGNTKPVNDEKKIF